MITIWIFDNEHRFMGEYDQKYSGISYAIKHIFDLSQVIQIDKITAMELTTKSVVSILLK